ncbi:MAG TPA: thiamine diphosphokinase, partial [Anaerolineales bacterium]|nr:thiamine diphosphokinase [Anaerolineales bacterium]
MQRIIIFANGELPDIDKARLLLRPDDYIICADGGTRHALALAVSPKIIIGDMDSVEKGQLQKLKDDDVPMELYPRDKNETDLELAIQGAIELKPKQIIILGALGGRLDQTLGNITLLSDVRLSTFDVRLDDGVEEIFLCRDQSQVHGRIGDLVSLIPWQGAVSNIQTNNLKWPLNNETLYPNKTRGISNQLLDETATISIGSGLLLIVHR